jgi:hypothetical protein
MFYVRDTSTGRIIESADSSDSFAKNMANCTPPIVDFTVHEDTQENVYNLIALEDIARRSPDQAWKEKMAETDNGMPRYLEDHIKDDHDGVAGNEFLQAKFDEKKLLRSEKP